MRKALHCFTEREASVVVFVRHAAHSRARDARNQDGREMTASAGRCGRPMICYPVAVSRNSGPHE